MSVKTKLSRFDWAAIFTAAFFVLAFLFLGAWPEMNGHWHAKSQNQTTGGQEYQRVQTILAAFSALTGFLTLPVVAFQAVIFLRQAAINDRQADIADRQLTVSIGEPLVYAICGNNFFDATQSIIIIESSKRTGFSLSPIAKVVLKNYGSSPAILRYINGQLRVSSSPPNENIYEIIALPPEQVLISGNQSDVIPIGFIGEMERESARKLKAGEHFIWLDMRVVFDDVRDRRSELFVCWKYDHVLRVFQPHPPERNRIHRRGKTTLPISMS